MILDEDDGAPKPTYAPSSPPAKQKAGTGDDTRIDAELAADACRAEPDRVDGRQFASKLWFFTTAGTAGSGAYGRDQTSGVQTRTFAKRHPGGRADLSGPLRNRIVLVKYLISRDPRWRTLFAVKFSTLLFSQSSMQMAGV
jgi:hypothetical protein